MNLVQKCNNRVWFLYHCSATTHRMVHAHGTSDCLWMREVFVTLAAQCV